VILEPVTILAVFVLGLAVGLIVGSYLVERP
jgi:hypothetical protein